MCQAKTFPINKIAFFNLHLMQDINHVMDFIIQNLALFFDRLLAVRLKYNCISSLLYTHLNCWTLFYFKKGIINGKKYLVRQN